MYKKPYLRHVSVFFFCIIALRRRQKRWGSETEGAKGVQLKFGSFLLPVNKSVGGKIYPLTQTEEEDPVYNFSSLDT